MGCGLIKRKKMNVIEPQINNRPSQSVNKDNLTTFKEPGIIEFESMDVIIKYENINPEDNESMKNYNPPVSDINALDSNIVNHPNEPNCEKINHKENSEEIPKNVEKTPEKNILSDRGENKEVEPANDIKNKDSDKKPFLNGNKIVKSNSNKAVGINQKVELEEFKIQSHKIDITFTDKKKTENKSDLDCREENWPVEYGNIFKNNTMNPPHKTSLPEAKTNKNLGNNENNIFKTPEQGITNTLSPQIIFNPNSYKAKQIPETRNETSPKKKEDFKSLKPKQVSKMQIEIIPKNTTQIPNNHFANSGYYNEPYLRLPSHVPELWERVKSTLQYFSNQRINKEELIGFINFCLGVFKSHQKPSDLIILDSFIERNGDYILNLIPKIARFALLSESLFQSKSSIRLLKKHEDIQVILTCPQICSLLSLMFFCMIPEQSDCHNLQKNNIFYRIFTREESENIEVKMSKISCVLNYFDRASEYIPLSLIFSKFSITTPISCSNDLLLTTVSFISDNTKGIEDYISDIMIDFACKYPGGGVLGRGCVQEEIMFLKLVEPIVSVLFVEEMDYNESLMIIGSQRYNITKGYMNSFRFTSDFKENLKIEDFGSYQSVDSHFLVMAASDYSQCISRQFIKSEYNREIVKSYTCFSHYNEHRLKEITTGNWGCGVFKGNEELKFIIQWISGSLAGKKLKFIYWAKEKLPKFEQFYEYVREKYTVLELYNSLEVLENAHVTESVSIFDLVLRELRTIR